MVHRRERIKHQLVHVNQQQTELELKKLEEEIKQPLCLKRFVDMLFHDCVTVMNCSSILL